MRDGAEGRASVLPSVARPARGLQTGRRSSMGALDAAPLVEVDDRETWRGGLEANHATSTGAWLVTWRRASGREPIDYEAAVEEALCFGWVDGQAGPLDELRSKLYFAPRKPGGPWAKSNRERIERLT